MPPLIKRPANRARSRPWISLSSLMMAGFGGIVALSVGAVLIMSVSANFANTFSLLNTQAEALLENMERSIRVEASQAERAVVAMAEAYAEDSFRIGDPKSQEELLKTLLKSAPVVETLLVYASDGKRSGMARLPNGSFFNIPFEAPSGPNELQEFESQLDSESLTPVWGEPLILRDVLYHNVFIPLFKDGEFKGAAVAAVGRYTLNRVISELGNANDTTAFILSSDNQVVAHSNLPGAFREQPIIALSDFPDPVLQSLPDAEQLDDWYEPTEDLRIFDTDVQGGHVLVTRRLEGYAALPYTLGAYFRRADIGTEISRAFRSAIVGFGALIVAIAAALLLGRRLARPMRQIADTAQKFSKLDLDDFTPLPGSRIIDVDKQASSMNAMYVALREFSRYVPHAVVRKLLETGPDAIQSVEREVTVLFTDLAGFTAITEYLDANETASLLNTHFDLVCDIVDKNSGTVDKFMGDGVMAFWGAPDPDSDHAANAVAAAIEIAGAMHQTNKARRQCGEAPLRVRMGLHSGRVVVGNIGANNRRNYTIVGDSVNVANRLEQLGKSLLPDLEVALLVSEATYARAGAPKNLHSLGAHEIRGRKDQVTVFALDT